MAVRDCDPLEPIDFGVDVQGNEYTLLVLDVTPAQWDRIDRRDITLPAGWSLDGARAFFR
jgi:hypothetical protein